MDAKIITFNYQIVMKRELILIRHTKSSWADLGMDDFDRPLNKDRTGDAKRMAQKLLELNLQPDLIICSPALRTRQTVEYFCSTLKISSKEIQFEKRLYESSANEYLEVIRETDIQVKSLIIVGHNPSITDFANLFCHPLIEEVPTTGVIWLTFNSLDWNIDRTTPSSLKCFLTPKILP